MKKPVKYTLHDEDDEDEDTVETRKSVKTAEKSLKKRFFINAWEKRQYDQDWNDGKISQKQMQFKEDEDEELGPVDLTKKAKQEAKKKEKVEAILEKRKEAEMIKADAGKSAAQKAEEKEKKE